MSFCLYRHYDTAGRLLYVGQTCDLIRRSQEHMRLAPWRHLIAHIEIERYRHLETVDWAERRAVEVERPMFNRSLGSRPVQAKKRGRPRTKTPEERKAYRAELMRKRRAEKKGAGK